MIKYNNHLLFLLSGPLKTLKGGDKDRKIHTRFNLKIWWGRMWCRHPHANFLNRKTCQLRWRELPVFSVRETAMIWITCVDT